MSNQIGSSVCTGDYKEIVVKDLHESDYEDHEWLDKRYSDRKVRLYLGSLVVDGDLDLDILDGGYAGIIVKGDLTVHGNIENCKVDLGIYLYVHGSTTANNVIAGGAYINLVKATIKNVVIGHDSEGKLTIGALAAKLLFNSEHHSLIGDLSRVEIIVDSVGEGDNFVQIHDLSKFWFENEVLPDAVDALDDEEEEEEEEFYEKEYYLDDGELVRLVRHGEETKVVNAVKKYSKKSEPKSDDLDIPSEFEDSVEVEWEHNEVVQVTITEQEGLEAFAKAILPGRLRSLKSMVFREFEIIDMPDSVKQLTRVSSLEFDENVLSELPAWIENFSNLESLVFNWNEIESIPDFIAKMENLTKLVLTGNEIEVFPECLKSMNALRVLDLRDNKITHIPEWLGNKPNLEEFYIRGNELESIPAEVKEKYHSFNQDDEEENEGDSSIGESLRGMSDRLDGKLDDIDVLMKRLKIKAFGSLFFAVSTIALIFAAVFTVGDVREIMKIAYYCSYTGGALFSLLIDQVLIGMVKKGESDDSPSQHSNILAFTNIIWFFVSMGLAVLLHWLFFWG